MGRMTSLFSYGKTCLKPPATYHSGTLPEQTKEGMLRPALRSAFAAEHGGGGMGPWALEVDPIKLLHGPLYHIIIILYQLYQSTISQSCWLIDWLVDWLIDWLVGWLIDWLIGVIYIMLYYINRLYPGYNNCHYMAISTRIGRGACWMWKEIGLHCTSLRSNTLGTWTTKVHHTWIRPQWVQGSLDIHVSLFSFAALHLHVILSFSFFLWLVPEYFNCYSWG